MVWYRCSKIWVSSNTCLYTIYAHHRVSPNQYIARTWLLIISPCVCVCCYIWLFCDNPRAHVSQTLVVLYPPLSVERFVIIFDSMSVLQAIESQGSKNLLVNGVLQTCQEILSNGKFIIFCWIPSHRDITGNEDAGLLQTMLDQKHNLHILNHHVQIFFIKIQPFVSSLWQKRWDSEIGNKLHAIMPQIDDKYYSGCTKRKDSFRIENRPHSPLCD